MAAGLRYLGTAMLYVASAADLFIAGVGNSVWLPVVLAALSAAGIAAGIALRVRAFLFLGAGFLLLDVSAHLWAFDHGVTFHVEPKLRTVLWGWAGSRLREGDRDRLELLRAGLAAPGGPLRAALAPLLDAAEVAALERRVTRLLDVGAFPRHSGVGPAIPWPPW